MPKQEPLHTSMTPLEWGFLLLLSLVWGGSFFFTEVALRDLPPFTIVFARLFFGAIGLLGVLAFMGIRMPWGWRLCLSFLVLGFFTNTLPFSLITWGQVALSSSVASILNATTPLFTLVIAHFFTDDEKISPMRLAGIVMGIVGVVVMLSPDVGGSGNVRLAASLSCLGAACCYGVGLVYGRRFLASGIPLVGVAAGQVSAAAVLLLPVALLVDRPWMLSSPSVAGWGALLSIGLLSTSLAYVLYYRILATAGASNVSLVTLLVPASAVLLGIGILAERLLAHQVAGMALIGLGLVTIDGRLWRRLRVAWGGS